jgi:hypothetical protein
MTTEEKILLAAYDIRGRVIQRAIEIESLIGLYIAERITKDYDKVTELISLVLAPRVSFENKVQIFDYMVSKYDPKFKEKFPKLLHEMTSICEQRNIYAHYPIVFNETSFHNFENGKVVTFVKLKNTKKENKVKGEPKETILVDPQFQSEDSINDILRDMIKYRDALIELVGD